MSINQVSTAIKNKQYISFIYDGHLRVVEPYCCGQHINTGNDCLRGLQTDGKSASKAISQLPFWDMFLINKMEGLKVLNETFDGSNGINKDYKKNDSHISPIVAQI